MGLPPVFKTKQPATSLYITILLSDSNLQAALWQQDNQGIAVLSKSTIYEYSDDDQAVTQADKALQNLGKQSEKVNDIVFGLPRTWADDQGVIAIKKPILKSITEGLDLSAVGFVMTSEALSKQLVAGDPRLSALLVEFSQYELFLSLIVQGKLTSTQYVGRSGETMADMTEALARLNAHHEEEIKLPAKIILSSLDLDESELKDQQQLLLSHDWVNSHPFVHSPTVDLLDKEMILEAVIKQGGGDSVENPTIASKVAEKPVKKEMVEASEIAVEIDSQETTVANVEPTSYGVPVSLNKLDHKIKPELKSQDEVNLSDSKIEKSSQTKMKFNNWFREHRSFAIGGFFAGIVTLLVVAGVWLTSGVKAVVRLSLATELISKETIITLSSESDGVDANKLVLIADTIDKKVSDKKTKETTGVKVVGDQAIGEITLYNKTEAVKSFDKGTKISKGDLVFTLDDIVEVASASTKETSSGKETEYGKNNVKVTAAAIGADSNIEKEIELQVASFDPGTYSATTVEAFSGGSSREVRVVSSSDRDQLIEDLRKKLLAEAQDEIEKSLDEGEYIASVNISKINEQKFDAEIADEIGVLTLDLSITVQALSYRTEDLKPLAQSVLEDDVPDGYTIANSEPQIMSAPDQESSVSGEVQLLVNITSEAKPDLDLEELKKSILGKSIDEAKRFLTADDGVKSVKIDLIPSIAAKIYARIPTDFSKVEIK
ncbi:MAG: hypothetical protein HN466_00460 [Candidatus Pacebacteria bacterium]|nr:hypothetical protein [Candidatus Paceibacterota bacterium]